MSREESFRVALRGSGIEYSGPIYIDGKLHRIRADGDQSNNSWYVLYPGSPVAGAYGCWKRDLKGTWCERNGSLTQSEWQNVRQRWQEASEKLEAETVARQRKARKVAAWILNRSRPALTLHRYLFRKGVKVFGNLRVYRRSLVLALRDFSGELQSLQFIAGDGAKNFLRGGRIAGCLFALADKTEGPLVICEGYVTGASIYEATGHAVFCAMHSGNLLEVAKAVRERWPQREIIIAADNDQFTDGNPGLTKATPAAKAIRAKLAVPQFKDLASKPTDFNDLAIAQGLDAVRQQVGSARVPGEIDSENSPQTGDMTDEETFARLAALSPTQYDRCRKEEAERLGIRPATLDAEVSARRPQPNIGTQGSAVEFPEVESWDTPVDGADVLNEVAARFRRYLALPAGAPDALALWTAHTHCFEAFVHTPRLNAYSPEKQCGKTTLLDVIATMATRPLRTESITAAVFFRLVESHKPTLLLDEVDAYLNKAEELRGLLNAGHKRGVKAYRCEGENNTVRGFAAFAPAALAGIGTLPGTLHDRAIVVRLARAKPGEVAARFDSRRIQYETELSRKLARWSADNFERLKNFDPALPETAFNRLADNWRPLFAIAEIAGSDWSHRTKEAFTKLTSTDDLDAHGVGTLLLADIAAAFTTKKSDKVFSAQLCEELAVIEGRPWAEWGKHREPISTNQLATQLRRFSVSPREIRIGEKTGRGYDLADFEDAFSRYLADTPFSNRNSETLRGKTTISEVKQSATMFQPENCHLQRECFNVSSQKGDTSENADSGERDGEAISADVDAFLADRERSAGKEKLRL